MGWVDADAHVVESPLTWDYLLPYEQKFRPQLLEFSDEYPKSLEGPEILASEVDRWLLSEVDLELFRETARDLQSAWTDEVLEKAVAQLPPEWRTVDNGFIAGSLKARRAELVNYVERFYKFITKKVDVHLTDHAERVVINRDSDEQMTVTATVTVIASLMWLPLVRRYRKTVSRSCPSSSIRLHFSIKGVKSRAAGSWIWITGTPSRRR